MILPPLARHLNLEELRPGTGLGGQSELLGFAEIQFDVVLMHNVHPVHGHLY